MKRLGAEADREASERADLQKALFVNSVLNAIEKENLSKSDVAKRMDCSRQYLTKILDEDASINFTIETMSNVTTACNRRLQILVLADDEIAQIIKRETATMAMIDKPCLLVAEPNMVTYSSEDASKIVSILSAKFPSNTDLELYESVVEATAA